MYQITDVGGTGFTTCTLSSTLGISSCTRISTTFWDAVALRPSTRIAVNTTSNKLYVCTGSKIAVCPLSPSGDVIWACTVPTVPNWNMFSPYGIALGSSSNRLFIANSGRDSITQCTIDNASANPTSCAEYTLPFDPPINPTDVTINAAKGKLYGVSNTRIFVCSLVTTPGNSIGQISSCNYPTGFDVSPFDSLNGITYSSSRSKIYVLNTDTEQIFGCDQFCHWRHFRHKLYSFDKCNDFGNDALSPGHRVR